MGLSGIDCGLAIGSMVYGVFLGFARGLVACSWEMEPCG